MNAHEHDELDPELRAFLEALPGETPDASKLDLDGLRRDLRAEVDAADRSLVARVRALATWLRRSLAALVLVALVALTVRPSDLVTYPPGLWMLYLASVLVLFGLCAFVALRPVHVPALPRWQGVALGLTAVVAVVVLSVIPDLHLRTTPPSVGFFAHFSPCFAYGFMLGLPVYGALRLLDRGNPVGRILAAAAAGLAGNLVLEMRCTVGGGAVHQLFGHAGVVAFYVVGVVAFEWALRRRAR